MRWETGIGRWNVIRNVLSSLVTMEMKKTRASVIGKRRKVEL